MITFPLQRKKTPPPPRRDPTVALVGRTPGKRETGPEMSDSSSDSDVDEAFSSVHPPSSDNPGRKTKVQKLGSRPDHFAAPVNKQSYQPILTSLIEQDGSLYDNTVSFQRIYGNRCLAGVEYDAPKDGDGLHFFLRCETGIMIKYMVANELWSEEARPHLEVLRGFVDLLGEPDTTPNIKFELPQLFHGKQTHGLWLEDENAILVHCGSLCTGEGDEYRPLRVGVEVPREKNGFRLSDGGDGCSIRVANTRLTFEWPDTGSLLQLTNSVAALKITFTSSTDSQERTFDAPSAMAELLMPEAWPYYRVKEARRAFAVTDRLKLDPLQELLLQCVADLGNESRLAHAMQLISSGKFRSSVTTAAKGEQFELKGCRANGIWVPDFGKEALNELAMRTQVNMGQLMYSPDFDKMVSVLADDGKLEQLVRVAKTKHGLKSEDEVCNDMLSQELRDVCTYLMGCGTIRLMRELSNTFTPFTRLVHDQTFEYDALLQINFNDGYCYDVTSRAKRRIRPSDGVATFINYPFPEHDEKQDAVLDSFLNLLFPNQEVLDYLLSELAKCLHMQQTSPKVLLLYGHGGGGKGMFCRLAIAAFGGGTAYGLPAAKELFMKTKSNAGGEGVSTARMQLKNKLFVTANEVRGFCEDTVKEWWGSDAISARGHHQATQQFTGTHNLGIFTFQYDRMITLKKESGLERRVFAIKTPNKYEDVKDAKAADALERHWNEVGETQRHAMYPEKVKAIMSTAPQLMLRLIQIHQQGAFKPVPSEIEQLTAAMWADAAPENLLQGPIERWYTRCGCSPSDPEDHTTAGLVDYNGQACTHTIQFKTIKQKLEAKKMEDGESLYKHVKGRCEANVLEMLKRVRLGLPPLQLVCKERHTHISVNGNGERTEQRNVFFGLLQLADAFPVQCQHPSD